ncbi:unnamed protein product, partial [Scytosiphon promiscuus]
MSFGCISPYLPVIWRSKGLSDEEIGVLGAVRQLSILFGGPFVCALIERHSLQQKALYGSILLFAITRPSVIIAGGFLMLAVAEASACVSESPIVNLIDASVSHSVGSSGYGKQRLWGAAGNGLSILASGYMYDHTAGGYEGVSIMFMAVSAMALAAAFGVRIQTAGSPARTHDYEELPRSSDCAHPCSANERSSSHDDVQVGGEAIPIKIGRVNGSQESNPDQDFGDEQQNAAAEQQDKDYGAKDHGVAATIRVMFSTPQNISFFLAVVLSGMSKGVIDTFLFIWYVDLGGSHVLLGLAGLTMCVAELPFFYLSGPLIRKIGPKNVVALAQIGYILRLVYYSVLQDPWWVLPAEILHGLTFAAMWAATTDYAQTIAPAHLRSTMQATVSGLKQGLGYGVGAVLGGIMYMTVGPRMCFGMSAALPCLSLVFLVLLPCIRLDGDRRRGETGEEGVECW